LIADATAAWVFETAGQYWAAKRVRGVATISNALTIEDDFDRVHTDAYALARDRRWVKGAADFRFASAFSDPVRSVAAGASVRRACTRRSLAGVREPRAHDFVRALTDHGHTEPTRGWRGEAPCAHASWPITRTAQQTTSSIIAQLDSSGPTVWATGTSSPCLSVFKPAPFDPELLPPRPIADARFDAREIWWAHERLHRACLADYHPRRVTFAEDRERFQDDSLQPGADPKQSWRDHRVRIDDWLGRALRVKAKHTPLLTRWFWSRQSRAISIPA
jgi:dipeptidase